MHEAVRRNLTAGVALVGAASIALTPIIPIAPDVTARVEHSAVAMANYTTNNLAAAIQELNQAPLAVPNVGDAIVALADFLHGFTLLGNQVFGAVQGGIATGIDTGRDFVNEGVGTVAAIRHALETSLTDAMQAVGPGVPVIGPAIVILADFLAQATLAGDQLLAGVQGGVTTASNGVRDLLTGGLGTFITVRDTLEVALTDAMQASGGLPVVGPPVVALANLLHGFTLLGDQVFGAAQAGIGTGFDAVRDLVNGGIGIVATVRHDLETALTDAMKAAAGAPPAAAGPAHVSRLAAPTNNAASGLHTRATATGEANVAVDNGGSEEPAAAPDSTNAVLSGSGDVSDGSSEAGSSHTQGSSGSSKKTGSTKAGSSYTSETSGGSAKAGSPHASKGSGASAKDSSSRGSAGDSGGSEA